MSKAKLNSISTAFATVLAQAKIMGRQLSYASGVSESTISGIKTQQHSGNVETFDRLLSVMPRQDQIAFVVELLRTANGKNEEDEENFRRNVKLLAKYLWNSHQLIFQEAINSLSQAFELSEADRGELGLTTLLSLLDTLSLKECADLMERLSLHLRHLAGLPSVAQIGSLALVDSTPIATEGILGLSGDGNIAHSNSVFSRLWQLPETLVLETQSDRLLLPYLAERVQDPEAFLAAVESEVQHPDQSRTHVVPLKTGQVLERRSTPVYARGEYAGRIIRYRDVSDMTALSRALRDSERQFRAFFDQNQIAMCISDLSGRFMRVNQAFCDLVGYAEPDLLQRSLHDLSHPDDLAIEATQLEQMQRGQLAAYTIEKRLQTRDGSLVPTQSFPCLVRDDMGQPLYVVTTIQDTSEQKLEAERREQVERELQQSEARYRAVVQDQTELICRFRPNTTLTFVNDAYAEYLGLTPEESIGKKWIDFLSLSEQISARAWLRDISAAHPVNSNIERLQVRRKTYWLRWTNRVVQLDDNKNVIEIQSIGTDITELKQTQDRLAERESMLQGIIDNVPGAVYRGEHSMDWDDMYISPAIEVISGYSHTDFLPGGDRTFGSIMHPDDRQWVYDVEDRAVRNQEAFEFTYRIIHANGSVRTVQERGRGAYDEQGNLTWIDGVILDVTDQKQQEAELQQIIQNIPGAVYRVRNDDRWTMVTASDGIESFTGYSASDFINGRIHFADLVHQGDLERLRTVGEGNGETHAFTIEYRVTHRDGSIRWLLDQGQGTVNDSGEVIEWSGVIIPLHDRNGTTPQPHPATPPKALRPRSRKTR